MTYHKKAFTSVKVYIKNECKAINVSYIKKHNTIGNYRDMFSWLITLQHDQSLSLTEQGTAELTNIVLESMESLTDSIITEIAKRYA